MLFLSYKLDEIVSQPKGKQKSKAQNEHQRIPLHTMKDQSLSCEMQIPAVDPRAQPATTLPAGAEVGLHSFHSKKAEKGQNQEEAAPPPIKTVLTGLTKARPS